MNQNYAVLLITFIKILPVVNARFCEQWFEPSGTQLLFS